MDIWERARDVGRHPGRLGFELTNSEEQGAGGREDLRLFH
jgi:hypothetical protein